MATKDETKKTTAKKTSTKKTTPIKKDDAGKKTKKSEETGRCEKTGKFTKGHKKMGGRAKGTPNKLTNNVRKMLQDQLGDHIANIGQTIAAIEDPAQKASALAQWTQYIIPKYSNTTINADTKRDIPTEEYIKELNDAYGDIKQIDITRIKIVDNG